MVEQDQVVQAQRRFDDAELSDDRPVLEELLHEEFLSIGPKGFLLDKRQWIDRHEHFAYHELQVDEMDVRMFGDAAIIRCVQRNHADSSASPRPGYANTESGNSPGIQFSPLADE